MHGKPLHDLSLKSQAPDLAAALPFHKRPRDPQGIADVWVALVKSGRAERVPVVHASLPYNNWPGKQLRSPLGLAASAGDRPMVKALLAVGADPLYRPVKPGVPMESAWLELCGHMLLQPQSLSLRTKAIANGVSLLLTNIGETGRIDQVDLQHIILWSYPPLVYQWIQYKTGDTDLGALLQIADPLANIPMYEWPAEIRAMMALANGPESGDTQVLNTKW